MNHPNSVFAWFFNGGRTKSLPVVENRNVVHLEPAGEGCVCSPARHHVGPPPPLATHCLYYSWTLPPRTAAIPALMGCEGEEGW